MGDLVVPVSAAVVQNRKTASRWPSLIARVFLAVPGGYAASAGLSAALSATLPFTGLPRIDSVVLASMLGFVIYLVLLLWGFVERRLWLLGGGLVMLTLGGFGVARVVGAGG